MLQVKYTVNIHDIYEYICIYFLCYTALTAANTTLTIFFQVNTILATLASRCCKNGKAWTELKDDFFKNSKLAFNHHYYISKS